LLGFGEALHGREELLVLRNHLFHRLVEAHGYSAMPLRAVFLGDPSSMNTCLATVRHLTQRCRRLD
jgi:erythromycin esterase-like protein